MSDKENESSELTKIDVIDINHVIRYINSQSSDRISFIFDDINSIATVYSDNYEPMLKLELTHADFSFSCKLGKLTIVSASGNLLLPSSVGSIIVSTNLSRVDATEFIKEFIVLGCVGEMWVDTAFTVDDPIQYLIDTGVQFHVVCNELEETTIDLLNGETVSIYPNVEVLCYNGDVYIGLSGNELGDQVFLFKKAALIKK